MARQAIAGVAALCLGVTCALVSPAPTDQKYSVLGLAMRVDRARHSMVVSCQAIPGYMEAMTMEFSVQKPEELDAVKPGTLVDFTLVVTKDSSYAQNVRPHQYQSTEQEPMQARQLALLQALVNPKPETPALAVGAAVPDFTLTDQNRQSVRLSQFASKVVAITFTYTSCPLPNFCFRLSNNFGVLQKRFADRLGPDLVLLSITFDPEHDQPEVLAKYAQTWKANSDGWHFLTGSVPEVRRVCQMFGVNFWPDEGLMTHSLHTVVIDRHGKIVANLEGNEFTAQQLGDLVESVLSRNE